MAKDLRDIIRQYSISILKNDPKWKNHVKSNNDPNPVTTTGTQSNEANPTLTTVPESDRSTSITNKNSLKDGNDEVFTATTLASVAKTIQFGSLTSKI